MPRLLAIDYGDVRIGLAVSDQTQKIAFEHEIWPAKDFFKKIGQLVAEQDIEKIILGYPINLAGEHTLKTEQVLKFKQKLEEFLPDTPIELLDERFSSQMAQNISGTSKNIDALAAQIFLQNYLNKKNEKTK